ACAGSAYPRQPPRPADALADARNNRALSLLDLGRQDEAVRAWREAVASNPTHLEAVVNLGHWAWQHGHLDDVQYLKRLTDLGRVHGDRPEYQAALAAVRRERGDHEDLGEGGPRFALADTLEMPVGVRAVVCAPGAGWALAAGMDRYLRTI